MGNKKLSIFAAMFALLLGVAGVQAQVWNSRANDNRVRNLLIRLETRTDTFRSQIDNQLDRSRWDNTRQEDNVMAYVDAFENATDRLRSSFNDGRASRAEVDQVLTYGNYLDSFMRRTQVSAAPARTWNLIRTDLNLLASRYSVAWNWNRTLPPFSTEMPNTGGGFYQPNDAQVRALLARIETRTNTFATAAKRRFDNNNRWDNTRRDEQIEPYIDAFENATDELRRSFNDRRVTQNELNQVLTYGAYVDGFLRQNRMANNVMNQWNLIRTDLNQLSNLYRYSFNWNQTLPPFTPRPGTPTGQVIFQPNENQVRNLLARIETRTDTFRGQLDNQLDRTRYNNSSAEDNVMAYVEAFENATDELRSSFDGRRVSSTELNQVLTYGAYVDSFMRRNQLPAAPERQWMMIRSDLNQLSNLYRYSFNWNQTLPPFPSDRWGQNNNRLDGTYRLNVGMSDDVDAVLNRTISDTTVRNRQRENASRRLTAPQTIAIETRGNQIALATDFGSQVSMTADGRPITETNDRGRTTTTRVTMSGSTLTIQTQGDRSNDYTVTFTPISGNRLRVTRSLYLENQGQMITANSVYDRTADVASWPTVNNNRPDWNDRPVSGNFYIPNGTRLTAVLRNPIATNVSQAGDRFSMEVTSPNQYSGAIITGRITQSDRSGRVSGRANLAMDFESIQYRGSTYSFAGIIDSAREADGDTININNEGTVRDGNQTTRTVTRAGIGAALGALIGAIAGGGQGAAIGAGVGAGAGAGSVLIQGRDNLQLDAGTEFSITATGPASVGYRN